MKTMKESKKLNIFMAMVPMGLLLVVWLISMVEFNVVLSPQERELVNFRNEKLPEIVRREPHSVGSIESPIPIAIASAKDFPQERLADVAPPGDTGTRGDRPLSLSLIVIHRAKKYAIIGGTVVKEGDVVDRRRVVRIEKNRVLLRDKEGETWLRLD
jgi:hypothetical protein